MARILIVHGIANQYNGEMELRRPWYDALCDGLLRAGHQQLPPIDDLFCPFYGDLFRAPYTLTAASAPALEDLEQVSTDEAQLLEAVWRSAAETDPDVPPPEEYAHTE